MPDKTLIIIPAYNELENLEELLPGIFCFLPDAHIVVIDSCSPDATAQFIAQKAARDPRIHLMTRDSPDGRGLADLDGFRYALENNFEIIIQMDADLSHHPRHIPEMLAALQTCDVVIGSRLIAASRIESRSALRNLLTRWANIYIRTLLRIRARDCTSGFRGFNQKALKSLNFNKILSHGPANLVEILYACHKKDFLIKEIPIIFRDRKKGKSKLKFRELTETALAVLRIKIHHAD